MPAPLALRQCGTGPAVVWVHGYTMDSSIWEELWGLLPGYRHVGVDLLGHGRSPSCPPATTLADLSAGVVEVLRQFQAEHLVALSMGTIVAFDIVLRAQHRLSGLVAAAPALSGMPAAPGTDARYRQLVALRRVGGSKDDLATLWMQSPPDIFAGTEAHPSLRRRLRSIIARHSWAELDHGGFRALHEASQPMAGLPGSAERLLVISGEDDMAVFSTLAADIAAAVPHVRALSMGGCGHLCVLEDPGRAATAIGEFLLGDPRGAGVPG